jgi:hypothetical protein
MGPWSGLIGVERRAFETRGLWYSPVIVPRQVGSGRDC